MIEHEESTAVISQELISWVAGEEDDRPRELIVEAKLPSRQVGFRAQPNRQRTPDRITTDSTADRRAILNELQKDLSRTLNAPPVVLLAAGALAIRATPDQARGVVQHPSVKRICTNERRRIGVQTS